MLARALLACALTALRCSAVQITSNSSASYNPAPGVPEMTLTSNTVALTTDAALGFSLTGETSLTLPTLSLIHI